MFPSTAIGKVHLSQKDKDDRDCCSEWYFLDFKLR